MQQWSYFEYLRNENILHMWAPTIECPYLYINFYWPVCKFRMVMSLSIIKCYLPSVITVTKAHTIISKIRSPIKCFQYFQLFIFMARYVIEYKLKKILLFVFIAKRV